MKIQKFVLFSLAVTLLASTPAFAVVVAFTDNPENTPGSPVPNMNRFFEFNGWVVNTDLTASDGNKFTGITLATDAPGYNAGNNGAGAVWPIAVEEYEASGTNNLGGTGLGKELENGDVIRFSFWMSTDASDPLLNEGTWTDSYKFEAAQAGATPGSIGAEVLDTGEDPPGLSFNFTAGNCDLGAGEASCSSHESPEITSSGWTQFSMQYEIDDFDFKVLTATIDDVVEIRPVMFLGDFTGGEDEQGTAYIDNMMVEVFDDIATANATAIVNPNPGGFVPVAGVAGDFDGDSDVDGADFLKWQQDGLSAADLTDWENNFGAGTLQAGVGSVPEPSTALLALLASTLGFAGVRRKR